MNSIKKWTKAHTLITVAIVAVGGYLIYDKFYKKPSGGTTAFTGGDGSYFR